MTDMQFALEMYGQALVDYHKGADNFDNVCFWQEQINQLAREQATEELAEA